MSVVIHERTKRVEPEAIDFDRAFSAQSRPDPFDDDDEKPREECGVLGYESDTAN
jgi:hypothetical protein